MSDRDMREADGGLDDRQLWDSMKVIGVIAGLGLASAREAAFARFELEQLGAQP